LALLLGGDLVLVTSRIGHGSHFRATIASGPAHEPEDLRGANETAPDAVGVGAMDEVRFPTSSRVLLAEDGEDNRRLIVHILSKAGATVTQVDNGQTAVDRARVAEMAGKSYDCILMDMQMPVMDGFAACRALRSSGYRGTIIALTAHAMAGDRQRCLDAGCDDYVAKPIQRRQLLQLVAKYCGAARSPG
jgi:CheY-like chemotaxis protein